MKVIYFKSEALTWRSLSIDTLFTLDSFPKRLHQVFLSSSRSYEKIIINKWKAFPICGRRAMGSDRIYYGTWGLVILMLGVSILLGIFFSFDVLGIVTLWVLSSGVILILIGVISVLKFRRSTARLQIGVGMLFVLISAGVFAVILRLFNIYLMFGIIIIVGGISIGVLGVSKKE
jgi:hypothetical protein